MVVTAPADFQTLLEQQILPHVFKPGRYLGMEQGAYRKPFDSAYGRMVLAFPDVYEIGASSYAIQLLYSVVNQQEGLLCDRVYAPAQDMRRLLAESHLPLFAVESRRPLSEFDLIAVSLQYELNYTTALGILEAAQLPLRAAERANDPLRKDLFPLVLAGGPGATNPNPMLPFFDGFMVGDGEDMLVEVATLLGQARQAGWSRQEKLKALAQVDGVYVPGYNDGAEKRIVDIAQREYQLAPLIPAVEAVHDRVTVEARRGCDRMCRFCQPAFINLPAREKDVDHIKREMLQQLEETGYEECSLLSLSIADYSQFKHLVTEVAATLDERNASLSLSSQRADRFSLEVAEAVNKVRKSTLTFAPEAGSARLRDVINKNLTDADIQKAVTSAYRAGWNKVKLYYMIGLPTETFEDLDGIVETVKRLKAACDIISRTGQRQGKSAKKHLEINLTLSNFVPKPHTPFQWHPQDTMESLQAKINYLRQALRPIPGVKANFTDVTISKLEAVISKGGPELADALERAYRNGAYLDAWDDTQPFAKWFAALEELGIDAEHYTRERLTDPDEPLPWDVINVGLDKAWLKQEWERSLRAASTTPCFEACSVCGVCNQFNVWPNFTDKFQETGGSIPPADGEPLTKDEVETLGAESAVLPLSEAPASQPPSAVARVRIKVQKRDVYRFISHLDWMRLIHRAVKRAGLPVAYSQGFNPKPKIGFSPALPLYVEALGEWVDLDLTQPVEPGSVADALNNYLPAHCAVLEALSVPKASPSVEQSLQAMDYTLRWTCKNPASGSRIKENAAKLQSGVSCLLEVTTAKGTQCVDLAASLQQIQVFDSHLRLRIGRGRGGSSGDAGWLKPIWFTQFLDGESTVWQIQRDALLLA